MKNRAFFLALLVSLVVIPTSAWSEEKVYIVPIDSDGVQRLEVVGGSYFYEPDHIIVKAGIPVEMTIKKEQGIAPHDIVLEEVEAGINFSVTMTSDPRTIRFIPLKTGTFNFFCSKRFLFFKSHRDNGMEGILEVRN